MDIKSEIIVLTNRQCMLNQGPRASTKVGGGGVGEIGLISKNKPEIQRFCLSCLELNAV